MASRPAIKPQSNSCHTSFRQLLRHFLYGTSMRNWFIPFVRRLRPVVPTTETNTAIGHTPGRSLSRTRLLLKKQLWVWPIIAVILLAGVGYGVHAAIERTMKASLQSQLAT